MKTKTIKTFVTTIIASTLWLNAESANNSDYESIVKNLEVIQNAQTEVLDFAEAYPDINILDGYKNNMYVEVLKKWFNLIDQNNESKTYFMADSTNWIKYVILEHLRFQLSVEHFTAIENRVKMVLDMSKEIQPNSVEMTYKVIATQLNLREAPILMDITKRALLNQGEQLSVIYTMKNDTSHWGFIRTQSGDRGWVNMKHISKGE